MKLSVLRKVLRVRERVRDVAAGTLSLAESKSLIAKEATVEAQQAIDTLFDQLTLQPPSSAQELLLFDEERQASRRYLEQKAQEQRLAEAAREKQRVVLQEKARALRTTERAIERQQARTQQALQKYEQSQSDEHGARRPR